MMFFQSVLPSGRCVRYAELDTDSYLDCEERAAAAVGEKADPGGARMNRARAQELVTASLRMVTDILPPERLVPLKDETGAVVCVLGPDGKPTGRTHVDCVATLKALTEADWKPVTAVDLLTAEHERSFRKLFRSPLDYLAIIALVQKTMEPANKITVDLGKVVKVSL